MIHVSEDIFGSSTDPFTKERVLIRRFTLINDMQMTVQIITLGATITSIQVPDRYGKIADVVLGYDDVEGYQSETNPYFGATVGRVCNRIAHGRFRLAGQEISVSRNFKNKHQLHGGFIGFDKVHWSVTEVRKDSVIMQHISPDKHEGYPGQLTATVHFTLTEDNCLHVNMEATTTETTVVNMTNHSYFNLAGHAAGRDAIYAHLIQIKADRITETDEESIPTGRLTAIENSTYDLRKLEHLGDSLKKIQPTRGYDDNFCVDLKDNKTTVIAKVVHPPSGRWLEVASNQPGVQFYTSNYMPDTELGETPLNGKTGAKYIKHSAFCLETQKYPDAVNHPNFPSIVLNPEETYKHEVIYKFGFSDYKYTN